MQRFIDAFAQIAQQLHDIGDIQVIWKDSDPAMWSSWPVELSQHRNAYCRSIKRSKKRLQQCCAADTEQPAEGISCRLCPFGVAELVVPFYRSGKIVGWCFVGCWSSKPEAQARGLSAYPEKKAKAAAELVQRLVEGILPLREEFEPSDPRFQKVDAYIEDNLSAALRASEVAAACALSSSRFVHWFKEVSGDTFSSYVNKRLMNRVATQLRISSADITEIALDMGFSSHSYFSAALKNILG